MKEHIVREYTVVVSLDLNQLEHSINEKLAEDWQVQGGVATEIWQHPQDGSQHRRYLQAMIR
jgi:hypothetical protein